MRAINVYLWGTPVGAAVMQEGNPIATFEYSDEIRDMGIELSPFVMPLKDRIFSFPDLPIRSFRGLPGLLSDSLPDKFGNKVLSAYLQSLGRDEDELSALDRLAYTGTRGMGALEYRPALFDGQDVSERLEVTMLARLAEEVLKTREGARAELKAGLVDYASILKVGSSAGGARAKALIGWNEQTGEVRSGQVKLDNGFGYWLIKFDGLTGNGDKEEDDKWGYGRVEYAYHLMARAAGIEMADCRLWDHRHFMTKRFDRTPEGGKLHMMTLGGMAHLDFNDPFANSYEQAFRVTRQVVRDARAQAALFRRMVFNVLAWNCDDHVKNISYLMDREGRWTLAPAYDVCYAYSPNGAWTSSHQMSVNGKKSGITDDDLMATGRIADLKPRLATKIIGEVREAVRNWPTFADEAEVREEFQAVIGARLGC